MNRGLLKLAVVGSRSSYGRLAGISVGVAVGVCLLLLLWGGANGLNARDDARCLAARNRRPLGLNSDVGRRSDRVWPGHPGSADRGHRTHEGKPGGDLP